MEVIHSTYYTIDIPELEEEIRNTFGREYSIVLCEDLEVIAARVFEVSSSPLPKEDIISINHWKKTGEPQMWFLGLLLNYLCFEGKIPPGQYLIRE